MNLKSCGRYKIKFFDNCKYYMLNSSSTYLKYYCDLSISPYSYNHKYIWCSFTISVENNKFSISIFLTFEYILKNFIFHVKDNKMTSIFFLIYLEEYYFKIIFLQKKFQPQGCFRRWVNGYIIVTSSPVV